MFSPGQKIYLIGIKGAGMTALAQVLQTWGCLVSGSDTKEKYFTDEVLRSLGIKYQEGFAAANVPAEVDLVVRSAAYAEDHPEVAAALRRGLKVMIYPVALAAIVNNAPRSIGIIGSHGKTTSTAMVGALLQEAGLDPTVFVGTRVKQFNDSNALAGRRDLVVAELCEYRHHFLFSKPKYVILTNIDWDHPDSFPTPADYQRAYELFLAQLEPEAVIVYNGDDQNCLAVMRRPEIKNRFARQISFGFGPACDWRAERKMAIGSQNQAKQEFIVWQNNKEFGKFALTLLGEHNVRNALGALIIALQLGVEKELAAAVFSTFSGTKRRFEYKGEFNGVSIYDDYAHHPTEIFATLKAAKERFFKPKIWCVFQAHTYSRTGALLADFAKSFLYADEVIINEVFASAREITGADKVDGAKLAAKVQEHQQHTQFIADFVATAAYLAAKMHPGDILITMGAGDAYQVADLLLAKNQEKVLSN